MIRDVLTGRITDRINELTRPYTHRETITRWGHGTIIHEPHVIRMPSLLTQLHAFMTTAAGASDRGGSFESRPAARMDALALLERIRVEATAWSDIPRNRRPKLEDLVRSCLGHLGDFGDADLKALDGDVRGWWASARILTTWDTPAMRIYAPCPLCSTVGDLYARVDPLTAICRACGESWDDSNIGLLGDHVRLCNGEEAAS